MGFSSQYALGCALVLLSVSSAVYSQTLTGGKLDDAVGARLSPGLAPIVEAAIQDLRDHYHIQFEGKIEPHELLGFLYFYSTIKRLGPVPRVRRLEQNLLVVRRSGEVLSSAVAQSDDGVLLSADAFRGRPLMDGELSEWLEANRDRLSTKEDWEGREIVRIETLSSEELMAGLFLHLYDGDTAARLLKKEYDISVEMLPSQSTNVQQGPCEVLNQPFFWFELGEIIDGFKDIPVKLRKIPTLKELTRARTGVQLNPDDATIAGLYCGSHRRILFFDSAFIGTADWLDEVPLHEYGHAVYENLAPEKRMEFRTLGWDAHGLSDNSEFVSRYSRVNVDEDFAEHFAAYINKPEEMVRVSPRKYDFFKKYLFEGIEFKTLVRPKYAVELEGGREDNSAPGWLKVSSVDAAAEANVSVVMDDPFLMMNVSGLVDGQSGIKSVVPFFCGVSDDDKPVPLSRRVIMNDGFSVYGFTAPLSELGEANDYSLIIRPNLTAAEGGRYAVFGIEVTDYSGNRSFLRPPAQAPYFPKTIVQLRGREKQESNGKQTFPQGELLGEPHEALMMTAGDPTAEGTQVSIKIRVKIPAWEELKTREGERSVVRGTVGLIHSTTKQRLELDFSEVEYDSTAQLLTASQRVPPLYHSGNWKPVSIYLYSQGWTEGIFRLIEPSKAPAVDIRTAAPDMEPLVLDADSISADVEMVDGEETLVFKVPYSGNNVGALNADEDPEFSPNDGSRISLSVRDPEGRQFSTRVRIRAGSGIATLKIRLPEYRVGGRYVVESIIGSEGPDELPRYEDRHDTTIPGRLETLTFEFPEEGPPRRLPAGGSDGDRSR